MKGLFFKRLISSVMLVAFVLTSVVPSYAQTGLLLPELGTMINTTSAFMPAVLKGMRVYPKQPLRFDFIVDTGNDVSMANSKFDEKALAEKLIRYFLASLTTPEKDLWVNLSPYEGDRIIPDHFGLTEMGRDLLEQDYILKQITALVIYPEGETGKVFWAQIYKKALDTYGTTAIPVDTFNKVWITPDEATVYVNGDTAVIKSSHLKVQLESDYLAMSNNRTPSDSGLNAEAPQGNTGTTNEETEIAKSVMREVVIPVLEKEVNEGKNFAQLRQIYHAMVLATWFKRNLKESLVGRVYTDQNKVKGIDLAEKGSSEKIWAQYVEAFKRGAFSYIKEEREEATGELIPRKYFSGGIMDHSEATVVVASSLKDMANVVESSAGVIKLVKVDLQAETSTRGQDITGGVHIDRKDVEVEFPYEKGFIRNMIGKVSFDGRGDGLKEVSFEYDATGQLSGLTVMKNGSDAVSDLRVDEEGFSFQYRQGVPYLFLKDAESEFLQSGYALTEVSLAGEVLRKVYVTPHSFRDGMSFFEGVDHDAIVGVVNSLPVRDGRQFAIKNRDLHHDNYVRPDGFVLDESTWAYLLKKDSKYRVAWISWEYPSWAPDEGGLETRAAAFEGVIDVQTQDIDLVPEGMGVLLSIDFDYFLSRNKPKERIVPRSIINKEIRAMVEADARNMVLREAMVGIMLARSDGTGRTSAIYSEPGMSQFLWNSLVNGYASVFGEPVLSIKPYEHRLGIENHKSVLASIEDGKDHDAIETLKGGIDLNAEELNLKEEGERVSFSSSEEAGMTRKNVIGFVPVVFSITTLTDPQSFFAGATR